MSGMISQIYEGNVAQFVRYRTNLLMRKKDNLTFHLIFDKTQTLLLARRYS
jgi:hypothetical protein